MLLFFILAIILSSLPGIKELLPIPIIHFCKEISSLALLSIVFLMVFKACDVKKSFQNLPWNTIFMVCGMTMYMEFATQSKLLSPLENSLHANANSQSLFFVFPFLSSVLSMFTSSAGVVLPLILNLLTGVRGHIADWEIYKLIVSSCINAHLVDVSPISTLGAFCIAVVPEESARLELFRKLILLSLLLAILGSTLSWIIL